MHLAALFGAETRRDRGALTDDRPAEDTGDAVERLQGAGPARQHQLRRSRGEQSVGHSPWRTLTDRSLLLAIRTSTLAAAPGLTAAGRRVILPGRARPRPAVHHDPDLLPALVEALARLSRRHLRRLLRLLRRRRQREHVRLARRDPARRPVFSHHGRPCRRRQAVTADRQRLRDGLE